MCPVCHFCLVLAEFGYPPAGMMGTVVKQRVVDVIYLAFSTWTVKWAENCLNDWHRAVSSQRTVTTGGPGVDTGARAV